MMRAPSYLLLIPLITAALCYWAGLSGPFLVDDAANLTALRGNGNGLDSVSQWLNYVFGGHAGTLGRSISLASFTLNAQNWPADPWVFKCTNLAIHLINGVLVYFLVRRLLQLCNLANSDLAALAAAAVWILHPLQVSTVLYVVQRMTQLATLFTLAGLIAFVHGRLAAAQAPLKGYIWMTAGIVGFGALATLSKESGALLPLFGLVLEMTVLRSAPTPPMWRHARAALLSAPPLLLVGWIAWTAPQWLDSYAIREFSPADRIRTQGIILLDYLKVIAVPRLSGSGLFFDNYPVAQSLPQVVGSWAIVLGLVVSAVCLRQRWPLHAAAVLWFFAGHALESTILPLEMYFEHRNYLPILGPALLVGLLLTRLTVPRLAGAAAAVAVLALLTHAQASIWGDAIKAAHIWPLENPNSARAHQAAAITWQLNGRPDLAYKTMRAWADRRPSNSTARLQLILTSCPFDVPVETYAEETIPLLRTGQFDMAVPNTLKQIGDLRQQGGCTDLSLKTLLGMIDAYRENPRMQASPDQLHYVAWIKGITLAAAGKWAAAIAETEISASRSTKINLSYWQTIWALELGNVTAAKHYLERAHRFDAERTVAPYLPDQALARLDEIIQERTTAVAE